MWIRIGALLALLVLAGCSRPTEASYLAAGKAFSAKSDYEAAVLAFKNAVRAKPDDAEAHYQLGLACLARGDSANGVAHIHRATELDPHHAQAQVKYAELMARSTTPDLAGAQQRIQTVLAKAPEDVSALRVLGLIEARQGKRKLAESHVRRALEIQPSFVEASETLASLRIADRDLGGAEKVLLRAISADSTSIPAQLSLARFYQFVGRIEDAGKTFEKILDTHPKNEAASLGIAIVQVRRKQYAAAETTLRNLAARNQNYRVLYSSYLLAIGKPDLAVHELQAAAKAQPASIDLRDRLVEGYLAANRIGEAEQLLTQALTKNHKDTDARLRRAKLYLSTERYSQASEDLAHIPGPIAEAHWLLAILGRVRGAVGTQRSELEEALRIDAGFVPARISLARYLMSVRDPAGAADVLDQAPAYQRANPQLVVERNWAWLMARDLKRAKEGISYIRMLGYSGVEAQLQETVLNLLSHNVPEAQRTAAKVLKNLPNEPRAAAILIHTANTSEERRALLDNWLNTGSTGNSRGTAMSRWLAGDLLLRMGDQAGAREAFNDALRFDKASWNAELDLAKLDLQQNRLTETRAHLDHVNSITGGQITAYLLLGRLAEANHQFKEAITQYRNALALDPTNVLVLNNLAYVLLEDDGTVQEALRLAQQAHDHAPRSAMLNDTLGWVYYRLGDMGPAQEYLRYAHRAEPNAIHSYHLAKVEEKLGNTVKAQVLMQQAYKLDPSLKGLAQ